MKPGELAMHLGFFRLLVSNHATFGAGEPSIGLNDAFGVVTNATFVALRDSGYYGASDMDAALAAIDRAILEAEALEDMGAVRRCRGWSSDTVQIGPNTLCRCGRTWMDHTPESP